jgi:hypothetical protein
MDIEALDGRLFLVGKFNYVNGHPQTGIATVRLDTGTFDPYFNERLTGQSGTRAGPTRAYRAAIHPDGNELVAIINASHVNGHPQCQMAKFDLLPRSVRLQRWTPPIMHCGYKMHGRDVTYSPAGHFLVVVTSGGTRCKFCDKTVQFRSRDRDDARPMWVNRTWKFDGPYMRGDTLHAVEHVGTGVYVAGHQRFNEATAGGDVDPVDRMGIALLRANGDAELGWRSDQPRCVGSKDITATESGVWVALDCGTGIRFLERLP